MVINPTQKTLLFSLKEQEALFAEQVNFKVERLVVKKMSNRSFFCSSPLFQTPHFPYGQVGTFGYLLGS